jgi:hypothetical protein
MEGPRRFITEETASGDPRGDFGHKGHMVGSVARDGREGGRGEAAIPGMVNEDPVEPDKGRVGTHIRPGVLAVAKGKLDEPDSVDSVVKELGLRGREVVIVPIRGMASEVEVPGDDPRDLISRVVSREVLEELGLSGRHTGGINIGETKPTVITVDSKVRGEDVA